MSTAIYDKADRWTRPEPGVKRALGDDPVPAPGHTARNVPSDYKTINGWGADLDPKNRPSYPKELPSAVETVRGDVKTWQVPGTKILQSIEHPNLTPVFGEAQPPAGLSGLLRTYAYQFGEGANRHWMTLMLADRVNVIESLVTGLATGRPDNYVKEKGWAAKVKYRGTESSRKGMLVGGVAVGVVALGILAALALRDDE
jgi:hypothetical protein